MSLQPASSSRRVGWIDFLRVLACFMVVMSHACDPFVGQFDNDSVAFITGTAIGSLMRPCVPLFVMMTGVLLLPVAKRNQSLTPFYKRRVGRLLWPIIIWSILLPVMGYCYFNFVNPDTANAMLSGGLYNTDRFIPRIWSWIFNFNYDTTALWYLYMLIGLYLIIPIINSWLLTASRHDILVVLRLWGISLLLPYVQLFAPQLDYEGNYGNYGILGVCDWNTFGTFYYLSGFIGYLILAYYLKTYPLRWTRSQAIAILLPMFVAGYAITFIGYLLVQELHPGDYSFLEIIWLFCGINVFLMTFPIFVTVQRIKFRERKSTATMASLTFGIYLIHFPLESAGYDIFANSQLPDWLRIIFSALLVFTATGAVVWLLKLSRVTRRFVS